MTERWQVKTDKLRGFKNGDIVVIIKNPGTKDLCRKENGKGTWSFNPIFLTMYPDWFEKIESVEDNSIVHVYGACDPNGSSWIYPQKPEFTDDRYSDQSVWSAESEDIELPIKNLFPKDKPIRFRLVRDDE